MPSSTALLQARVRLHREGVSSLPGVLSARLCLLLSGLSTGTQALPPRADLLRPRAKLLQLSLDTGVNFLQSEHNSSLGDLADWEANSGLPLAASSTTVPEPTTLFLVFTTLYSALIRRRF